MALSKFISRAIDKCFSFFRLLKKVFDWDEEYGKAFQELKVYLRRLPLINKPKQGEVFYVSLSISEMIFSSVLIREENGVQMLVYYTSQAFRGVKERYAHIIQVLIDQLLRIILHRP